MRIVDYPRLAEILESINKHQDKLKLPLEVRESDLEYVNVHFKQQGNYTVAIVSDFSFDFKNETYVVGVAKRNPRDRWNRDLANHLALYRAIVLYFQPNKFGISEFSRKPHLRLVQKIDAVA